MAKNNKKINIGDFVKVTERDFSVPDAELDWHGLPVRVKRTIPFLDMMSLVQNVVELCFMDDTGEFIPQVQQLGFKSEVIRYYTNIKVSDDLYRLCDMVYKTDLFDFILPYINEVQLGDIAHAIDKKISQVSNIGISNIHNEVIKLISKVDDMMEELTSSFEGVDSEDVNSLINSIRESIVSKAAEETKEN